jgi:hypothetical protein
MHRAGSHSSKRATPRRRPPPSSRFRRPDVAGGRAYVADDRGRRQRRRGVDSKIGCPAGARAPLLRPAIPGAAHGRGQRPAVIAVAPVGVLLEATAALAGRRAIGERQARRLGAELSLTAQRLDGRTAQAARDDRDCTKILHQMPPLFRLSGRPFAAPRALVRVTRSWSRDCICTPRASRQRAVFPKAPRRSRQRCKDSRRGAASPGALAPRERELRHGLLPADDRAGTRDAREC